MRFAAFWQRRRVGSFFEKMYKQRTDLLRKTVNNYGKNPVVMIEYRKKAQECEGPVSKWQQDVLFSGERKGKLLL